MDHPLDYSQGSYIIVGGGLVAFFLLQFLYPELDADTLFSWMVLILLVLFAIVIVSGFRTEGKLFDLQEQDLTIHLPYEDAFFLCMKSVQVFWYRSSDEVNRQTGIITVTRKSWLDDSLIRFSLTGNGRDTTRVIITSGSVSRLHFPPGENAGNLRKIFRYLDEQSQGRVSRN